MAKAAGLAAAPYRAALAIGIAGGSGNPLRPLGKLVAAQTDRPVGKSQQVAFRGTVTSDELQT